MKSMLPLIIELVRKNLCKNIFIVFFSLLIFSSVEGIPYVSSKLDLCNEFSNVFIDPEFSGDNTYPFGNINHREWDKRHGTYTLYEWDYNNIPQFDINLDLLTNIPYRKDEQFRWKIAVINGNCRSESPIQNFIFCDEHSEIEDIVICKGESYKGWNKTGSYIDTLLNKNGCDSIVTTNLTVIDSTIISNPFPLNNSVCYDDYCSISWDYEIPNPQPFTKNSYYYRYGNYDWRGPKSPLNNTWWIKKMVGNTFYWKVAIQNGQCITESPVWSFKIRRKKTLTKYVPICEGESYEGRTESCTYIDTFHVSDVLDSIVTTYLFVNPSYQLAIEVKGDTIISINTYRYYQWYDENGEIDGEINQKCIIKKSGEYYLIVTDNNGCTITSAVVNVVYTSINSTLSDNFKYSIIPNPNRGKFTFRVDSNILDDLTLKLVNAIGQTVEVREVASTVINHSEQFDVSHLSKGIYYLVISSDQFQRSEKIVVQ